MLRTILPVQMFVLTYCFVFVVVDAKIATIFEYPNKFLLLSKNLCSGSLKIAIRHPKISGLKIAVHSLKIAGLKIIARVCVYVRMWVRMWVRGCVCGCVCGCAPHFAEVSKIVQDAPRAGTQQPEQPPANTSDHHRHPAHAHSKRN